MNCSQTDPEAAKVVFEAGVPLVMVPLEVGKSSEYERVQRGWRNKDWNANDEVS